MIGHAADYTTLKSSSGVRGFCSSIYRFQTSSVTLLLVATQYPRARRCCPQDRFRSRAYSLNRRCELFPFQIPRRTRHRHVRRNPDQQMRMVPMDRSGMEHQFPAMRDLAQSRTEGSLHKGPQRINNCYASKPLVQSGIFLKKIPLSSVVTRAQELWNRTSGDLRACASSPSIASARPRCAC